MSKIIKRLKTVLVTKLRLLSEWPRVRQINAAITRAHQQGKMVLLFEITTTNEFFYLKPLLEGLHREEHLVVIMSGFRLYQPLKKLIAQNFTRTQPRLINLAWNNSLRDLDFYINATLSYDIAVPNQARFKISLPHTITSKTKYDVFSPAIEKITDIFITGEIFAKDLEIYCRDHQITRIPRLHQVGCPKSDALFDHQADRIKVLTDLGLDPALPTVFYAPTWNPGGSIFTWLDDILKIPETHQVNLIIKVHPGAYIDPANKKSSGGIDWAAFFNKEQIKKNRIVNAMDTDSPDLIMASDITITDISTIWIEYYFLGKPMIFLEIPEFWASHEMNSLGDFRDVYGYLVKTPTVLNQTINAFTKHTLKSRDLNVSLGDRLLYNKGRAAKAAVETIKKLYKQEDL